MNRVRITGPMSEVMPCREGILIREYMYRGLMCCDIELDNGDLAERFYMSDVEEIPLENN